MKHLFFILLSVFTFSVYGQKAIYTDNNGDGIIEYTLLNDLGKVMETGYYKSGKMVGTWISYHPNGKKMMVAKFKNGIKEGTWWVYDNQGRVLNQIVYKNNRKISASQHSYANNQ